MILKKVNRKNLVIIILCLFSFVFLLSCKSDEKESNIDLEKVDEVIAFIDFLPSRITLENKSDLDYIASLYTSLNDEEKALVTNYYKYLNSLEKYDCVLNEDTYLVNEFYKVEEFIENSIATIIDDDVVLLEVPKEYTYKNASSAYIYNITFTSNNESVIDNLGNVIHKSKDIIVTLTFDITINKFSFKDTYTKEVKVLKSNTLTFDNELAIGYYYGTYQELNQIDIETLDIINYSFAQIKEENIGGRNIYTIDYSELVDIDLVKTFKDNGIRVCISLGGWHDDSSFWGIYQRAASTKENRKMVADAILEFLQKYDLDGIDMDWEYPNSGDRTNFTLLMQEIKSTLKSANPNYIVTAAIPASSSANNRFDLASLDNILDLFYIMTYDLDWSSTSDHVSDLATSIESVNYFIKNGVSKNKIVIGSAFYGRAYVGVGSKDYGLYKPFKEKITLNFHKINELYLSRIDNGVTKHYDSQALAYYLYDEENDTFVTYDSPESIKSKWDYAKDEGLGGIMYWSYQDDLSGILMQALHDAKYEK